MPTYIDDNFKPDLNTLNILRKKGIFADFCDYILPHFKTYWGDLKTRGKATGRKSSWQATFMVWAERAHRGRVGKEWEEVRHQRREHGGLKNDLFETVLDRMNQPLQKAHPDLIKNNPQKYKLPDPPQPGPAMSADEALQQMKSILNLDK